MTGPSGRGSVSHSEPGPEGAPEGAVIRGCTFYLPAFTTASPPLS